MENNQRPTKEITLEHSKAVVTLYEYVTGRDKRAIQNVYMREAEMSTTRKAGEKDATVNVGGIKGTVNELMEDAAFSVVIKSLLPAGGELITDSRKILDFILDSHEKDLEQIKAVVNEITDPKA